MPNGGVGVYVSDLALRRVRGKVEYHLTKPIG